MRGGDSFPAATLAEQFLSLYQNPGTRAAKRSKLRSLFSETGVTHPAALTEQHLIEWCTGNGTTLANNTVRQRISEARTFLAWCHRNGHVESDASADLLARHSPLRRYQRVYGKKQAKHPGRWLTREEAFGTLIASTQNGTDEGLRDEIVLRLGLLGMRDAEIASLRWSNLEGLPAIAWTGKGHTARTATAGPTFTAALHEYRRRYVAALDRPLTAIDPVVCRARPGPRAQADGRLTWGRPLSSVFGIINRAGKAAGLGHIAPHDLRRTAAGILHNDTTPDGAHNFDLLDIQKVLGHADPATTMRSYLDPMDTGVFHRAGSALD